MSGMIYAKDKSTFTRLQVNVKTHTEPGKVKCRATHSCIHSPCKPGMRMLSKTLRPQLDALPHLVKYSRELAQLLSATKIPEGSRLIKLDISDFFMTGEHDQVIDASSNLLPTEERTMYRKLAEPILKNPYICVPDVDARIWKVRCGTGMGLISSGDMSNAAYYTMVENNGQPQISYKKRTISICMWGSWTTSSSLQLERQRKDAHVYHKQ